MKKGIVLGVIFMSVLISCKNEKEVAPAASEEIVVEEIGRASCRERV